MPNPNCATYEMNCAMDPIFCNTYRSLCQCSQECVDELCVAAAPGCKTSAECTSAQTQYCVEGKCAQCDKDSACPAGTKCAKGVCTAACKQDENCPLMHACEDGACVEHGCKTDRECAFTAKNQFAVCHEGECELPCMQDADCTGTPLTPQQAQAMNMSVTAAATRGFQVCDAGKCVFVGCENNAECRALLGLENQRTDARAVCR